jgi:hypothetical protein
VRKYNSLPYRSMALFSALLAAALPPTAVADTRSPATVGDLYGNLPLHFEANQGQTDRQVRFFSRGSGYSLFLTASEAVLVLQRDASPQAASAVLRMGLAGANPRPLASGLKALPGSANYLIGDDASKWRTNVPTYGRVRYQGVYPGIDLVYYGNQRQLEYDFVVAPGADPRKIELDLQGVDELEIDGGGDLVLRTAGGDTRLKRPIVYQEIDGVRRQISGRYILKGTTQVGFEIANYDTSRPLTIDPVLAYSTFLAGNDSDSGRAIAVDSFGNAYVTGFTQSTDFPTTAGASAPVFNGNRDVFVTKLNVTGAALVYSTFIGGSGFDEGTGIAVDASGAAYVTGQTQSANFPATAGAFDTSFNGGSDAFVAKLDATGSTLVYSTFLDGSAAATAAGIAIDGNGNAYVTGQTSSADFPVTAGAFQPVFQGGAGGLRSDAFLTKIDAAGAALVYSSFLGGTGDEQGQAVTVDGAGSAYVAGVTLSTDFPTTGAAFDTSYNGNGDAFVARVNGSGSTLLYATLLGGSSSDSAAAIALDATGAAYVTGGTSSADFPVTAGAFDNSFNGAGTTDAFVTKLDANGSALVYSTLLGGSGGEGGSSVAVDATGTAYVAGDTSSQDFPTTAGAFDTTFGCCSFGDAFVIKLNPAGSALAYSTYLGGNSIESLISLALDAKGAVYVTGFTGSPDFPTTPGAFDTTVSPGFRFQDAFVSKLSLGAALLAIDKEGIDNGKSPNFFSSSQVNNDVAEVGVRAQLRFFRDNVGQTITLPSGQTGAEGWFALRTIPASWTQAGGIAGYVGNPAANPEDPLPQGTGPGLGSPDANGRPQSLLKSVPDVTPLLSTGLGNLTGRLVCAVVYDNQVEIDYADHTANLRGRTLGTVAFQVLGVTASSSGLLPDVQVLIRDAATTCKGPFALLTNTEAPTEAPPP